MKRALWHQMNEWAKKEPISMHVPGHKNGTIGSMSFLQAKYDVTEITGFDDLHQPETVLKESMSSVTRHPDYDAFYLVNGTTSGILSVIHAFQSLEGRVLLARNVHKSVFNALDLGGQQATILPTIVDEQSSQYVQPDMTKGWLSSAKLSVVTYPNYYGQTFDVSETIQRFHANNCPVLVDEAHGAHFDLDGFPVSAMNYGADFVVQSFHKTLPSLTMSSILFIHKNAPQREDVIRLLQTFQSSSPSYLLMASLEVANDFYEGYDSQLFFERRQQLLGALSACGLSFKEMNDPLKLLIYRPGMSGDTLQQVMESVDIYVELSDSHHVLWVLPLWHTGDSYPFDDLITRIHNMVFVESMTDTESTQQPLYTGSGRYEPQHIAHSHWVPFEETEGKVLAQHLVLYPPGIPSMLKGEKVTEPMIELMSKWCDSNVRVEGLQDGKIKVKDD
ncbi:aminotransferase class V-fold PLP-dependent enzyme [Staphylococcus muscae]|uniref:Lysine decarboxylase n=1 Tax=Staphylococcus muscae TaxID=1294 RepID=A0A240BSW2_9STAP|nr:aminotransferase class V-fold PLP-dependent enzyme [Staphylococcus muscae]AVQ34071.1 aminotransferase class V-fold PLP-dependent enzyme [Staphylococcus muscae]PNZ01088.1 aminotransferase class V-fold PLP-dependent enzyme [Staphylococcus muscae]GGA95103.1 lysine decarboxylase [Staphylococcus muscae]SNV98680.1 Orn Lys Arg decarboxylase family protein [Staphylococcus muscae]